MLKWFGKSWPTLIFMNAVGKQMRQVPDVMDAILAKLHEVCIFTVPKYYEFSKVCPVVPLTNNSPTLISVGSYLYFSVTSFTCSETGNDGSVK